MTRAFPPTHAQLQYIRIYSDALGESHFDTVTVELELLTVAPPAPLLYVSAASPATGYLF